MKYLLLLIWAFYAPFLFGMTHKEHTICVYKNTHKPELLRIALQDITRLATTLKHTPQAYQELLDTQIAPAFESPEMHTRVALHNNKPTGFVTYSMQHPWHRILAPSDTGPNATIHHLAVDRAYRRQGIGEQLAQTVITDCRNQSVNRLSLWANHPDLLPYYEKLGFEFIRTNSVQKNEFEMAMRFKPHPALRLLRLGLQLLKR